MICCSYFTFIILAWFTEDFPWATLARTPMGCPGNSRTSSCASCWTATFGACVYRQKPVGHVPLVKVVYAKHNSELGLGACKHHMGLLNSEDGSIEMFLMFNGHILAGIRILRSTNLQRCCVENKICYSFRPWKTGAQKWLRLEQVQTPHPPPATERPFQCPEQVPCLPRGLADAPPETKGPCRTSAYIDLSMCVGVFPCFSFICLSNVKKTWKTSM